MEEIQLKVEKSYPIDLGRGIIRLDPTTLLKLQLSPGDVVEIQGKKKTTAKVWRADRQDWDQGLVRIGNFIRQNAGVSIGEKVTIKKVEAAEAKKLILALPESMTQEGELQFKEHENELIKRRIIGRPVLTGDIIPIVNSASEPILESRTPQVIPLVVVEINPANSIVKVSEETEIEIRDKAAQNKVAQTLDVNNKFIESDKQLASLYTLILNKFIEPYEDYKKDDEVNIITLSEAIVKTKDHYEKISSNIKEYNANSAIENSIILTNLDDIVNKSDKIIYEFIYNLKLKDAFSYVNELDSKLEIYHKAALSETAHRKIKEIEFQINSPFFASKLRKNYKKLVSEFDKLDTAGIQGTKNIKEFIETSKGLMEKLQETEDDLEEEQKTGIRSTLKTIVFWGIPVLLSFYSLVADKYFTVNFYTPIIFLIFLSGIVYLLLKYSINFKIIHLAYKNNIHVFKKSGFLSVIPATAGLSMAIISFFIGFTKNTYYEITLPSSLIIFSLLFIMICMIGIFILMNDSAKEAKSRLIKKEVDNLIKRYELDSSI